MVLSHHQHISSRGGADFMSACGHHRHWDASALKLNLCSLIGVGGSSWSLGSLAGSGMELCLHEDHREGTTALGGCTGPRQKGQKKRNILLTAPLKLFLNLIKSILKGFQRLPYWGGLARPGSLVNCCLWSAKQKEKPTAKPRCCF